MNFARILGEMRPKRFFPEATAASVCGLLSVVYAISFVSLIFSGSLAPQLPVGVGIALYSAFALSVAILFTSQIPSAICIGQDKPAAILAIACTSLIARANAHQESSATVPSVLALITLTTISCGLFFMILARMRVGRYTRYIPYPVVGGFVAATGWLVVQGSFKTLTGETITFFESFHFLEPRLLVRWLPSLLAGLVFIFSMRRWKHYLVLPGLLIGSTAVFYAWLAFSPLTLERARAEGWLLGPFHAGSVWTPPHLASFASVSWDLVFAQLPSMVAVALVSAVSVLFNTTALELNSGQEVDLNRELLSSGAANLLSGLGGGVVGYHSLSLTALNQSMGNRSRFPGLLMSLFCLGVLVAGPKVLGFFPMPVLGALLFYLGISFMAEWLHDNPLPRADRCLVVLIVVSIAIYGFISGVIIGLVVATVLFVMQVSHVGVVKSELAGSFHRSRVERSPEELTLLQDKGDEIRIFHLQGFLFFGTFNGLIERISERIGATPSSGGNSGLQTRERARFILLDFKHVDELDSSAIFSFARLEKLIHAEGVTLVLTALTAEMEAQLAKGHCLDRNGSSPHLFADLDRGIEFCENEILRRHGFRQKPVPPSALLADCFPDAAQLETFLGYLERRDVAKDECLFREGERSSGLFLVESGEVSVLGQGGDRSVRVRVMGAGTVVGEMGIYAGESRSATVTATRSGVLHYLSPEALERLRARDSEAAERFDRFIVHLLVNRLQRTTKEVQALLE